MARCASRRYDSRRHDDALIHARGDKRHLTLSTATTALMSRYTARFTAHIPAMAITRKQPHLRLHSREHFRFSTPDYGAPRSARRYQYAMNSSLPIFRHALSAISEFRFTLQRSTPPSPIPPLFTRTHSIFTPRMKLVYARHY